MEVASPEVEPAAVEPAPTTAAPAPAEPAPAEPAPAEPAAAEPTAERAAVESRAPAPASLLAIPGANVTVGTAAADGLRVAELACAVDRAPLMGTLVIIGSLAKHDAAFDRCAPKGDAAILEWRFADGRAADITVRGASSPKVDACLAAALRKVAGPFDAHCGAVLQVGKDAGADAALARLLAAPR